MTAEAYGNYRFYVEIDGFAKAIFTELSGLQVETTLMDYEEGGNNGFVHRLPGRTKISNITLKRGIVSSNDLFKWYMEAINGTATRRNVTVVMYDSAGKEVCRWDFVKAFPVKWVGPQFSADGKNLAVETFELAHNGLKVE